MIAWGREERPPSPKRDGGASTTRSSGPQALPSPVTPELAPRPRDPVPVPAADAVALLFLPPALRLVHPALYLPAAILAVLLTPARASASLLAAPPCLPPTATTMPTTSAASKPQWTHCLRTQAAGHPVRVVAVPTSQNAPGGGGRGAEHPVAPGITQPLGQVPLHRHPFLSSSAGGERPRRRFPGSEAAAE